MRRFGQFIFKPSLWLCLIFTCWQGSFVCCSPISEAQAQIYKGSKYVPNGAGSANRNGPTQTKNYFTVIGEVKYPETYELPTAAPSLIGFLKLAGGLQPSASGSIRIVRFSHNGHKAEEQLFYDERRTDTLRPGDVVVVDSKMGNARLFDGPNQSVSDGDVYVALIGILEYPFVMQTAAKNATINWITQQLHQKEALAATAKVSWPGRSTTRVTPDTELPNNTLIHFDSTKVVFSQLPDGLPRPFRPGYDQRQQVLAQVTPPQNNMAQPPVESVAPDGFANSLGAPRRPQTGMPERNPADNSVALDPERVDPPAGRVRLSDPSNPGRASRNTPTEPKRLQPEAVAGPVDVPVPETPASPEFRKPFQSETESSASGTPGVRNQATDDTTEVPLSPINDDEVGRSGSSLSAQAADSILNRKAVASSPKSDDIGKSSTRTTTIDADDLNQQFEVVRPEDEEAESEAAQGIDLRTVLMVVIGGVGSFSLVWVLLSMMKPAPSQQRIFAEPKPTRPVLDRLVNNEFEIRIEDARIDQSARIHGRPRDIGQQRLDTQHQAVSRPHFMGRKSQTVGYAGMPNRNKQRPAQTVAADRLERVTAAERRSTVIAEDRSSISPTEMPADVHDAPASRPYSSAMPQSAKSIDEPTSEPATNRSRPKFRLDTGRGSKAVEAPHAATEQPAGRSPVATTSIKPSRAIAEGSDIVDRALAAFERGE